MLPTPVMVSRSSRISVGAFALARAVWPGSRDDALRSAPWPLIAIPQIRIDPTMLQPVMVIPCGTSQRGAPLAASRDFTERISIVGGPKLTLPGPVSKVAPLQVI